MLMLLLRMMIPMRVGVAADTDVEAGNDDGVVWMMARMWLSVLMSIRNDVEM